MLHIVLTILSVYTTNNMRKHIHCQDKATCKHVAIDPAHSIGATKPDDLEVWFHFRKSRRGWGSRILDISHYQFATTHFLIVFAIGIKFGLIFFFVIFATESLYRNTSSFCVPLLSIFHNPTLSKSADSTHSSMPRVWISRDPNASPPPSTPLSAVSSGAFPPLGGCTPHTPCIGGY